MSQDLEILLSVMRTGLSYGTVLALIALGYTMVYGIVEMINFAHGDLFTFGFFISLMIWNVLSPPTPLPPEWVILILPIVLILTALLTGGLNVAIERVAYRPLRKSSKLAPLITAVGMSFALQSLFAYIWGGTTVNYPRFIPTTNLIAGLISETNLVKFTPRDILVLVVTIPLMIGLMYFVGRTRMGKAMRASAQDREAAAMVGINVNRIIATTFFIGGALAGVAGMIYGLYFGQGRFIMGFEFGLFAFTSAVLGGVGNIGGAVLGAYIIGMVQASSDFYVGGEWSRVIIFSLLILMLVFRPSGLLGSTQSVEKV